LQEQTRLSKRNFNNDVILMPDGMPDKHSIWLGAARTVVSGVIAAGAVIFFFGGREAKINDLVAWKIRTEPVIQRMDTTGTLSFDLFHREYERTQHRQEEEMKELEKRVRDLERDGKP
jgi:RNA-splicing ligase RtcB